MNKLENKEVIEDKKEVVKMYNITDKISEILKPTKKYKKISPRGMTFYIEVK